MKSFLVGFLVCLSLILSAQTNVQDKLPNSLNVKIKEAYRAYFFLQDNSDAKIEGAFKHVGKTAILRMFPNHTKPREKKNKHGFDLVDLSLLYTIKYSSNLSPEECVPILMATGAFEFVEPVFIPKPLLTPNDPDISGQYYLELMNLFAAWDSTQGDTNVVIGISDTGFDIDHPELVNSVKYNYADTIDGIDNDNDGKIDNFRGWDLGENDNDPSINGNDHGVVVSGFAGATVNNGFQKAGTGYNCKLLPIKISNAAGVLTEAYNSIVFAADQGCDIVNCSWGAAGAYSETGQNIVNYATFNKNCLVIASAGNSNNEGVFYPASFNFVLSVGGVNANKEKWILNGSTGSNYNQYVSVVAPSTGLLRLRNGGGALVGGGIGTSLSAPIVSGIAGLVKSKYPFLSAVQLLEQIKATAIDVDTVPANASFKGMLGKGLVDANRAVNDLNHPGLIFNGAVFTDFDDDVFRAGDTVYLHGNITNVLNSSSAGTAYQISSLSPYIELIDSSIVVGAVGFDATISTIATPLVFRLKEDAPYNLSVDFKISMVDGSYYSWNVINKSFNPDYIDVSENNVTLTIAAGGKLGYAGAAAEQSLGSGIKFKNQNSVLYQMGIIASLNETNVSSVLDDDFERTKVIETATNKEADFSAYTSFNDEPALANKIGIEIAQKTLVWKREDRVDFVILELTVKNTSASNIEDLNLGLYADWDIVDANSNVAALDSTRKLAYVYQEGGTYAGIHLLSDSAMQHYAFNNNGSLGSINIYDGFSSAEQHLSLSQGLLRNSAPIGDVAHALGIGGLNIPLGDSVKVAFAIVLGDSLVALQKTAAASDTAYQELYQLNISAAVTNVTCFGACDGLVKANVVGGVKPYVYNWGVLASDADTVAGVCAGNYNLTISDQSGIVDSVLFTVAQPDSLSVFFIDTINDVGSVCGGGLTASVAGGSPSYNITWDDDISRDSLTAKALCVGTYTINIQDLNGCTATATADVSDLVSISNLVEQAEVIVFPNPTNHIVNIKNVPIGTSYQIIAIDGRLVRSDVIQRNTVSFEGLMGGSYLLRFNLQDYPLDVKITLQR